MSKNNTQDKAFEQFYRSYRLFVHALCKRRFQRKEVAMDLESLVWMEVHRSFEQFQDEDPRAALRRIVRWRANDLYRQQYRAVNQNEELVEDDQDAQLYNNENSHPTVVQHIELQRALATEDQETVELLVARFVEGYSWAELADKYQVHRNTMLNRTNAALERLRAQLGDNSTALPLAA
jgi:RNA polymerase sigma factor (sigma-70 family)